MNVAKQRRKLVALIENSGDPAVLNYASFILVKFDDAVAAGRPVPASEFIEMMKEEFE